MMNRFLLFYLAALVLSTGMSCVNDSKGGKGDKKTTFDLLPKYTVFPLPKELNEISGIVFIDSNRVLAVEDETGTLYQYDLAAEKIVARTRFAGKGDYEDLALVNNDVFVVTSKGDLFRIRDFRAAQPQVDHFKTPLTAKNNIEGLAYDARNQRLLLASKDEGVDHNKDKEIYAFSLNSMTLSTQPVYAVKLDAIEQYFKGDAIEESSKKFLKALGSENLNEVFRPSAITIHPGTGHLYVLSSVNHFIAVLDSKNTLLRVITLKGKIFTQPEGVAFSPSGQLYVSNEANGKIPTIIRIDDEH